MVDQEVVDVFEYIKIGVNTGIYSFIWGYAVYKGATIINKVTKLAYDHYRFKLLSKHIELVKLRTESAKIIISGDRTISPGDLEKKLDVVNMSK